MLSNISLIIENCLIGGAWIKPETIVTDRPEIYKTLNPVAPYEFLNGIYRTRFSSENFDQEIDRQFRYYAEQKCSFRWYTFSHSEPKDLEQRLFLRKPAHVTEMGGLYCEVDKFDIKMPEGITVEELCEANLEEYADTVTEGWGQIRKEAAKVKGEISRDFHSGNMRYRAFLSRYRGEPASTGILLTLKDGGYLAGGSTRPTMRGKGAYAGLVRHRVRLLREMKVPYCFIAARKDTSAPICLKLGFQSGCECKSFTFSYQGDL